MAPSAPGQPQRLHRQVGRENEKPGNRFTAADFATQRAEEIGISLAAELAENLLPDKEDCSRHDYEAYKQQHEKEGDFAPDDGFAYRNGQPDNLGSEKPILAHTPGKIKRRFVTADGR